MKKLNIDIEKLNFQKDNDLITAVIQDEKSRDVLMVGYQNREAVLKTLETGQVIFWSRTKKRLWKKGETSGNCLEVLGAAVDCDQDSILYQVKAPSETCHTGSWSCFGEKRESRKAEEKESDLYFLLKLKDLLQRRKLKLTEGSYVTSLFNDGLKKMGQKVGEEGVEVSLEAESGSALDLKNESADLLFHLMVLCIARNVSLLDIVAVLESRDI